MFKKVFFFCLLIAIVEKITACDYCNCYLGLNPQTKKNIIGLRYHFSHYTGTHLSDEEVRDLYLDKHKFTETHTTVELYGQLYPVQKLQVLFSIPYIYNVENVPLAPPSDGMARSASIQHDADPATNQLKGSTQSGISDPVVLAHAMSLPVTSGAMP